ncbi:MAG: ABC transporter substrate-binding protein [Oscillospiraceae bacterium]|nr:ABC transporter substrate-binding protein [Oscillospiraceae bacterium]
MKKLIAMLLALVMVLSLAACGASEPAATEAAPADTQAAAPVETEAAAPAVEPVTLNVAYMANWGSLWAVATADAKGYFAEEGITINLTQFEDGPSEIAAMKQGSMDVAFIGPGAHKLCSKGDAQVFLMQHMGDGDCILGLNGIKTLEELKGKKVGYSAGTSSESILTTALASVGLTMDDIEAVSMDATALTTAALSGQVDAVAAWSPMSLTILDKGTDVTDICSNADFATMASPGSWVVNPDWAAANADVLVRFNRAMFKAMDFASAATTDDAVAQEVAGYVAAITGLDVESTVAQRYDGSWLNSTQVLEMIESGKLVEYYNNQQVNFGDAAGPLKADEFVLVDLMINAK